MNLAGSTAAFLMQTWELHRPPEPQIEVDVADFLGGTVDTSDSIGVLHERRSQLAVCQLRRHAVLALFRDVI